MQANNTSDAWPLAEFTASTIGTHLRLSHFHSHAKYLACLQKSFPFANWDQLTSRTLNFANVGIGWIYRAGNEGRRHFTVTGWPRCPCAPSGQSLQTRQIIRAQYTQAVAMARSAG